MELEAVLELSPRPECDNFHLVFCAVPSRGLRRRQKPFSGAYVSPKKGENTSNERSHDSVFIRNANLIKQPQQVISSGVWLEPAKERVNFLWQVFRSTKSIRHLGNATSEGKGGVLRVGLSRSDGNGVSGSVESAAKVSN